MKASHDENRVTYFAITDTRNKKIPFGIKAVDRTRHVYVIGKTGMGKSTLLENMAIQDIRNGEGFAFVDPHGGTAEKLLDYIPENRLKDVLYFAPFDMEYPVAFNVMEDIGPDKRHLVLSGLMSAFKKLFGEESFSDRMQYILQNTILALLEYPGATMLGINKMLAEKEYRNKVIANITDPSVRNYWVKEYAGYTERFAAEAIPAIQNKIGQFTSNPLIRNIIGQQKSTFDLRKIMDDQKILIINLSKGRVGEGNANLLGSMFITKIYLAAMSRADASESALKKLPNFYLYVDEFQSFANESFADILSEARKYKLNLTIAHQYVEQMSEEVRAAVIGNVGTMVVFRVGAIDAELFEKEFAPQFTAEDIVNLGRFQMYLKLMINGVSSPPFSANAMLPIERPEVIFKDEVVENSRAQFARTRAEVEKDIEAQTFNQPLVPPKAPSFKSEQTALSKIPASVVPPDRSSELQRIMTSDRFKNSSTEETRKPFAKLGALRDVLTSAMREGVEVSQEEKPPKKDLSVKSPEKTIGKVPESPLPKTEEKMQEKSEGGRRETSEKNNVEAKEEKKSELHPPRVSPPARPPQLPSVRIEKKPDSPPVQKLSLNDLKVRQEKSSLQQPPKGGMTANKEQLKSALRDILKKEEPTALGQGVLTSVSTPAQPVPMKKTQEPKVFVVEVPKSEVKEPKPQLPPIRPAQTSSKQNLKEIPDSELKKLLSVEKDGIS